MQHELLSDTVKVAPAVTYSGVALAGISIADWVSLLTAVYVFCMLITAAPKAYHQLKKWYFVCKHKLKL